MKSTKKPDLFSVQISRAPARRHGFIIFSICYFVSIAPPIYFLHKNYQMLEEIGVKFFPSLLGIINQDQLFIIASCLVTFLIGAGLHLWSNQVFLKQFYKPLDALQKHMSQAIYGEFSIPPVALTHENYSEELIKTYNYLYGSIQSNLKRDLIFLQELENVHSPELARVLINEKLEQLNLRKSKELEDVPLKEQKIKVAH